MSSCNSSVSSVWWTYMDRSLLSGFYMSNGQVTAIKFLHIWWTGHYYQVATYIRDRHVISMGFGNETLLPAEWSVVTVTVTVWLPTYTSLCAHRHHRLKWPSGSQYQTRQWMDGVLCWWEILIVVSDTVWITDIKIKYGVVLLKGPWRSKGLLFNSWTCM